MIEEWKVVNVFKYASSLSLGRRKNLKDFKTKLHAFFDSKKLENVTFFNKWSKTYDNFMFAWWMRYLQEKAIGEVLQYADCKILDVGCATGNLILKLRKKVWGWLFGTDISPEMIKKAQIKLRGLPKVKLDIADAEKLPYRDNTFDCVICTTALHHFPNPFLAVKEMSRVLKKAGKLVVIDTNFFLPALNYLAKLIEPGFVKMYTKQEFKRMFEMADVLLEKQKRVGLFAILNVAVKIR